MCSPWQFRGAIVAGQEIIQYSDFWDMDSNISVFAN